MGMTESEWAEPVWQQGSWIIQRLDALTARVVELSAQVDELEKRLDREQEYERERQERL